MERARVKNTKRNPDQTCYITEVMKNVAHAISLWIIKPYGSNVKAMEKCINEDRENIAIYRSLQCKQSNSFAQWFAGRLYKSLTMTI